MTTHAITFTIRPGSQRAVAEILSGYGRPAATVDATTTLRRTSVFLKDTRVVRVVDVDGDLGAALRHLANQPEIQAVEEALAPHLAEPRDMSDPEQARAFFARAVLRPVFARRTAAELLPTGIPDDRRGVRHALLYPVKPGCGDAAAALLAGAPHLPPRADRVTSLAATSVFGRDDVLVRVIEVDGDLDDALDHLTNQAVRSETTPRLAELLDTPADLSTPAGFRQFLDDAAMTLLTDRRLGVPV